MKEIGGYLELQLPFKEQFYTNLINLNSGRSCLEYILRAKRFTKIYIPYYICDVIFEPIRKMGMQVELYSINENLTLKSNLKLNDSEALLYVNYFGIKDDYLKTLSNQYANLIIDNAQAFYSRPNKNTITYYSPRKFFGVSDGGYLAMKDKIDIELDLDKSYRNSNFLLTRIDAGAEEGYKDFRSNEDRIRTNGLKRMSNLTTAILSSLDYVSIKQKREENFYSIHNELGSFNQLKCISRNIQGPMVYPFLTGKAGLREFLLSNKIFVAKYWDNLNNTCDENSVEYLLATKLVALPIDQRYGLSEMNVILNLVKSFLDC
jgi:hypothetical protein